MALRLHDPRVKSSRPRVQDASQEKHARHLPRHRTAYPALFPQTRPVRTPDRQLLPSILLCTLSPVPAFSPSSHSSNASDPNRITFRNLPITQSTLRPDSIPQTFVRVERPELLLPRAFSLLKQLSISDTCQATGFHVSTKGEMGLVGGGRISRTFSADVRPSAAIFKKKFRSYTGPKDCAKC